MRIFTGKGDQGTTDLLGDRVSKDDPVIELLGTLDEASSAMGLARSAAKSPQTPTLLTEFQRDLYQIMAEVAFTNEMRPDAYHIGADRVSRLEDVTNAFAAEVDLPPQFILPGDTCAGATLDVARTVVRRAERRGVELVHAGRLSNGEVLRYLNRLSSFLFVAARAEDHLAGIESTRAKKS
jgi:cob(I)alamin adenosyltransferase